MGRASGRGGSRRQILFKDEEQEGAVQEEAEQVYGEGGEAQGVYEEMRAEVALGADEQMSRIQKQLEDAVASEVVAAAQVEAVRRRQKEGEKKVAAEVAAAAVAAVAVAEKVEKEREEREREKREQTERHERQERQEEERKEKERQDEALAVAAEVESGDVLQPLPLLPRSGVMKPLQ